VVWKDWSGATAFQDVYDDQWLFLLGGQYTMGPWKLRAGYSYFTDSLRDTPNQTLDGLRGFGAVALAGPIGVDFLKILTMAGLPGIVEHTFTAGVGYDFNQRMSLNVYGAYSLDEKASRTDPNISAALTGPPTATYTADVGIWTAGVSLNFKF
jgi:long-chain fatty acid transport protein